MPGFIITKSAALSCPHSAPATPDVTDIHVKVAGQAIVLQLQPYTIAACTAGQSKCTKGAWSKGASRVQASGTPVAISTGTSQVVPAGVFTVVLTQQRVKAT